MKKTIPFLLLLAVIAALLIAGCTQQQQATPVQQTTRAAAPPAVTTAAVPATDTVKLGSSPQGTILMDAQGKTLYYFANDRADSSTSACTGQCAATWPAFSVNTIQVSSPLDKADFASITRADGTKQTTYYGWPLYYYQKDTGAGDTNGDGVLGFWFVVKPDESVFIAHTADLGSYLTDSSGKTLYVFMNDGVNSTCTGACLAKWPAFGPDYPLKVPSVLDVADFAALTRDDGVKQSAYKGRPLYYYSGDGLPGDVKGQGFNNLWYAANVSGKVPAAAAPKPTAVPTTVAATMDCAASYGSCK
jgi:predicted lipoprotein with Yx(FWY)xxD motif